MASSNHFTTQPIHAASLGIRMLQGGVIAFILISLFLLPTGAPNPEWGKYWMIKPLVVVPLAGTMGGVLYYLMDHLRSEGGWKKVAAILLSIIGYIMVLWIGTILGLNGTYWD